eukprot:g9417.t1
MGNLINCVPVVPSEEGQGGDNVGDGSKSGQAAGGRAGKMGHVSLMSEVECTHEPPTTITKVLSNALYAMAFHKHLALTNRSENYEFFQAVSHFTFESCANKQLTTDSARKIYNLYVSEAAPLRVALGDEIYQDIKKAIEGGEVSKNIFDAAQVRVLSLMESESLSTFLSSDTLKELSKRIREGEMDKLVQEDIESVKDIMSKEFIDFLGDPGLKEILSSRMGVDWFRQYLVIEFAEEGLDLLTAIREMLDRNRSVMEGMEGKQHQDAAKGEREGAEEAGEARDGAGDGAKNEQQLGVEGASGGGEVTGVVAPAAEGEGGRVAAVEEEAKAQGGAGGGEAGHVGEFDIRKSGQDLFERFIKSGCGAECNLPGTIVNKVSSVLANDSSTPEEIAKAFEAVDVEIFKLLAYDPFLRFKRSGMYTKYCMKARLKSQRSSLTQVEEMSQNDNSSKRMRE